MISINCPFCHKGVFLGDAGAYYIDPNNRLVNSGRTCLNMGEENGERVFWRIGICPDCKARVLVKHDFYNSVSAVYPYPMPRPIADEVPDKFKKDLSEADMCFSINAYRAASMLCRRLVHSIATDNKCASLNEMKTKGLITDGYLKQAYAVKLTGDSANHAEEEGEKTIEREDAEAALEFTHALIDVLYVQPSKIDKQIKKFKK
ncbi:MAG: DUF4145 domain-containing protein [Candidatus Micrarchaeia archaeon]